MRGTASPRRRIAIFNWLRPFSSCGNICWETAPRRRVPAARARVGARWFFGQKSPWSAARFQGFFLRGCVTESRALKRGIAMKKNTLISTLVSALISLTVYGQNQTGQSGTTTATTNSSSSSTGNSKSSTDASLSGSATTASGVSFTNKQGQTYSVDKLADELKTLRSTVDQVMPMLQAFNETYSNSVSGDRTLTGRLSGLLSDSLHRNESATSNNNNNSSSTQSSGRYGNVVTALQG